MIDQAFVTTVMTSNYIGLAIPVFFGLIMLEAFISSRKKLGFYRLNDSIASLTCGVMQSFVSLLVKTHVLGFYAWFYFHLAMLDMTVWSPARQLAAGMIMFIIVDFCYYWFHRCAHQVNIIWAAHVVHHQSEEYNLTTALRQSMTQYLFGIWFYLPLAIVGFPPEWLIGMSALNTVGQFWFHTRVIGKFPKWIEAWVNTPSHHRVHHGRNPEYIDKNHGGVLIIWDRLFGTFQPELISPTYGITTPLHTFNPITAQFGAYKQLWRQMRSLPGLKDKLILLISRPGWTKNGVIAAPEITEENSKKFNPSVVPWRAAMASLFFMLGLTATLTLLVRKPPTGQTLIFGTAIIFSLYLSGRFLMPPGQPAIDSTIK